jgi:hypothetical protein
MNLIDKAILEWSYKTSKGYPDINNQEDMALFESIFGFELGESNMGGKATGYPSTTGTFEKYVRDKKDSSTFMYSADKDTILIPTSEDDEQLNIKKGEEFNIISKSELDLIKKGASKFATVKYGGKEYLINLTAINKPTGKGVEKFEPGDSKKLKAGVLHHFIPGHAQEKDVALLFQNASDENYEFEHKGKKLEVTYIGEPRGKTPGKPKTDLFVELKQSISEINSNKLKISLKAGNATFVENWTRPSRALQIFDKDKLKQEVIKIYNGIVDNTLLKKGTTTLNLAFFISTSSKTYSVEGRGPLKLNDVEALEAYTATNKFGADSELTPNCFFKGNVPESISEFIDNLVPFDSGALKYLEDLYIHIRGSNESRGGSLFIKRESIDSPWYINPDWATALGIKEEEVDGVRKYK